MNGDLWCTSIGHSLAQSFASFSISFNCNNRTEEEKHNVTWNLRNKHNKYFWLLESAAKSEVFIPGAEQASIILPANSLLGFKATADKQLALWKKMVILTFYEYLNYYILLLYLVTE